MLIIALEEVLMGRYSKVNANGKTKAGYPMVDTMCYR